MTKRELRLAKLNGTLDKVLGAEIDRRIGSRYAKRDENAITRHMLVDPIKYADEFSEYNSFVESVKAAVKAEAEAILGD